MNNAARPSQPAQLDTRADSPMREKAHHLDESSVNRNTPHGLPTPANDVPSSGFTAVNGDVPRITSFRPDDSARLSVTIPNGQTSQPDSGQATSTTTYNSHSWRPEERPHDDAAMRPNSPSNKRKRGEAGVDETREDGRADEPPAAEGRSPKRPMTVLNSGGIPSPDRTTYTRSYSAEREEPEYETASTGHYVREPSPTTRHNAGTPPPQARPETVSSLAASLNATMREEQQARAAAQSASPQDDADDQYQSHTFLSGLGDPNDNDPKRRKRNFSNRTKTGCHTCRGRKKKCDEGKPICENCRKGGFSCGGYGPKPPGGKLGAVRTVVPLQPNKQYEPPGGTGPYYDPMYPQRHASPPRPHWPEPPRHDPYNSAPYRYGQPPLVDHRPPSARDGWGPRPSWGPPEHIPPNPDQRLPPVNLPGPPPAPGPSYPSYNRPAPPPAPPPAQPSGASWGNLQSQPPFYPHPHHPGPPTVISSHESTSSHHSGHSGVASLQYPLHGPPTEKRKMLTGLPYKHFLDDELIRDRESCKRAVETYNKACAGSSTIIPLEREAHFQAVIDPRKRPPANNMFGPWLGPIGANAARTVVESPFDCTFGYNINLGKEVVVEVNCFMQDACPIYIGDRTVVGPNVKFYCMTTSVDASKRGGSHGTFMAGSIRVEEDCFIGADSIILPFRTIGKGAVVGAGSVVTKDVKPYTVVAGNPAALIRKKRIDETDPNVEKHERAIQEENDAMLELMKTGQVVPVHRRAEQ